MFKKDLSKTLHKFTQFIQDVTDGINENTKEVTKNEELQAEIADKVNSQIEEVKYDAAVKISGVKEVSYLKTTRMQVTAEMEIGVITANTNELQAQIDTASALLEKLT